MAERDPGLKRNVAGVLVDATTYELAVEDVLDAAKGRRPLAVSALAVHGVMTGVQDPSHRYRLNHLDLVTPDGQPVRWAMNLLHGTRLKERVYGPTLTGKVLERAASDGVPVYFYGSTPETLAALAERLPMKYPGIIVAGMSPSKFRRTTADEKDAIAAEIVASGARIVFVGLGCPRQEVFVYEYRDAIGVPLLAVGAAFDYHAGLLKEPPAWMQRVGLQWLYRLAQDPRRLWRRYLLLNPEYVVRVLAQRLGLWRPDPDSAVSPAEEVRYG
jgi:N-acetylglucosaminyldiphosphoundecaprenol N-acetyl-beta-D-mannosaminyltransferase